MEYFKIDSLDDLNVIGHYPQTELKKGYNPRLPKSHWQVHPYEFPDFEPELEITLHKNANPTDILHFSDLRHGSIVSLNFIKLIEKFNLPPHRFYPIKVYHKGQLLEYYWFHFIIDIWEFVDLGKSSALIFHKFTFEIQKIIPIPNLDTVTEFKKALDRKEKLMIKSLVLKGGYPNYDVVETTKVEYSGVLFSKKLVGALKEANLTGFEAIPYDKIVTSPSKYSDC